VGDRPAFSPGGLHQPVFERVGGMGRVSGRTPRRSRTEREQRAGQAAEEVGFGTCRGEGETHAARGFDEPKGTVRGHGQPNRSRPTLAKKVLLSWGEKEKNGRKKLPPNNVGSSLKMSLSGQGRREKSGLFSCLPRVARGNCFWGSKDPARAPSRRSGRVGYQSRQKSLKRAELNAVYLVVCVIETCPNQA
jgi:hypothetical protein